MTESTAPRVTGQASNGASPPATPSEETGSPLFAGLVWAHYCYERERRKPKPGPELAGLEKAYSDKLNEFQRQVGELDHVYWSTRAASAVAMTVVEKPSKTVKWLDRWGPAIVERDQHVSLHRLSDWVTPESPRVADLLHECDVLGIRVGEVLRGTPELIAMRWILRVQEHLLGFIERTRHMPKRALKARENELVRDQHRQLVAIEAYYQRAASSAGRLRHITGPLKGRVPDSAPDALLGLLARPRARWHASADVVAL